MTESPNNIQIARLGGLFSWGNDMAQVLDQPFNNSVLVDGPINDKPIRASGLDGIEVDTAVINTFEIDKAIQAIAEPTLVTIPQV